MGQGLRDGPHLGPVRTRGLDRGPIVAADRHHGRAQCQIRHLEEPRRMVGQREGRALSTVAGLADHDLALVQRDEAGGAEDEGEAASSQHEAEPTDRGARQAKQRQAGPRAVGALQHGQWSRRGCATRFATRWSVERGRCGSGWRQAAPSISFCVPTKAVRPPPMERPLVSEAGQAGMAETEGPGERCATSAIPSVADRSARLPRLASRIGVDR